MGMTRINYIHKKIFTGIIACVLFSIFIMGCGSASSKLTDVTDEGDGKYSVSYEGVKHNFIVDLPEVSAKAPLVLMLHGYANDAESFRSTVHFENEANENGIAVVYVTGAPNQEDATSATGWNSGIGISSNDDVGFLVELVKFLCKTYDLDSSRVYAVGYSNGAFMCHRLALEANDTFNAVVCVAGMMPESVWENKANTKTAGVFQVTGEKDDVIPQIQNGSNKYAKAPAIEDVMDYYITVNNLKKSDEIEVGRNATLTKYEDSNGKKVWNLFVPGGRHSWPEEEITRIDMNHAIIEFISEAN